ncbi:hypothetical protein [Bifidobacterium longum]|uniref:hypothetical protein n=1 Tax=Bifidobacterium longum TaxID=216816 RepID=UPI0032DF44BF
MWFELVPAPRADETDDDVRFQRDAKAMADAIGLSSRPGWLDWWRHDDGCRLVAAGERRWVEVSDRYGQKAGELAARAANASIRACGRPDVLDRPRVWAHAFVPISASLARTARDGEPSMERPRLDAGEDTVIVVNVRRLGWVESGRLSDWLGDEYNMQADTSKLRGEGLGACRVMAGGADPRTAMDQAKRAANALNLGLVPGLSAHVSRPGLGFLLCMLLLTAVSVPAVMLPPMAPGWLMAVPLPMLAMTAGAAIRWRLVHDPVNDLSQRPRHYWWRARRRWARAADLKTRMAGDDQNADGPDRKRRVHAYAFQRSTLPLPCGALAALAAPSGRRNASVSALTVMPDQLDGCDGPVLGVDAERRTVRMSVDALYGGVFLMGEPGGGKSNMMHGVAGWMGGRHRTGDVLVDFESKGVDAQPVLKRLIPGLLVVDVNDPGTPMIDLLGAGSNVERAGRFADLMQAALGVQQIGPQSRIQLRDATFVALEGLAAADLGARCNACSVPVPDGWVEYAARLLGRNGVMDARMLGRASVFACDTRGVRDAVERLHGGVSDKGTPKIRDGELAGLLRAPMNKMDVLASAGRVFAPSRRVLSWASVIRRSAHAGDVRIMVNLGAAIRTGADGRHADLPDGARRLIGALLFRGLKDEIVASCAGWQARGRAARILVDELTDVLGADGDTGGGNADILAWLREKGRAYGVQLVAGTQNAVQLEGGLLASVTGLMTVGTFVLRADLTAGPSAVAVGSDPATVRGLPLHTVLVRTVGPPPDMAGLPPMILSVPHFDAGAPV